VSPHRQDPPLRLCPVCDRLIPRKDEDAHMEQVHGYTILHTTPIAEQRTP
jgi:uncharacterized C2H2 Zn-finger protein